MGVCALSVEPRKDRKEPAGSCGPYDHLYIYLLNGLLREKEEACLGDSFIGNWVEADSSFLFFSRPSEDAVGRILEKNRKLELVDNYRFSYEEWQGGGLDRFEVDLFSIAPPWIENGRNQGVLPIVLDPGVVFGNGLHPTTRDCLRALIFAQKREPLGKVLDLGTGTGILALAAALLGAEHVVAVDLNPLCVKTALQNVRWNQLTGVIDVFQGPAERFVRGSPDLIAANIHCEVVEEILNSGAFAASKRVLLSGLMRSEVRKVKAILENCGFDVVRQWDHEMTWHTVLACNIAE